MCVYVRRNPMVKVVARSTVKPGKTAEFKAIAARLIAVTRKEKGCLSYELCQDVRNEQVFCFMEEWHDGDALAAHMQSKHFNSIVPLLNEIREGDTEICIYRPLL